MDAEIAAFARRWHMPLADAQRFAAGIARRCGEIAATIEADGLSDFESLALAEALGAQISDAIAQEFPDPGADGPAGDRGPGGFGIGGPSKL
jgi:hypothetical protein